MTNAQIKFGLALADDLRRIRRGNGLPDALIPLNTNIGSIVRLQRRLGIFAALEQYAKKSPRHQ